MKKARKGEIDETNYGNLMEAISRQFCSHLNSLTDIIASKITFYSPPTRHKKWVHADECSWVELRD